MPGECVTTSMARCCVNACVHASSDAADEVGIFISPALPSGGCHDNLLRTWEWQINALRNNPSVMDMAMENEGYGVPPSHLSHGQLGGWPAAPFTDRAEFYAKAKALNPGACTATVLDDTMF